MLALEIIDTKYSYERSKSGNFQLLYYGKIPVRKS